MGRTRSDAELLARLAGGREAAEALFRRYAPMAYGLALDVTGEASAAEDVVQEAFLNLLRRPPGAAAGSVRSYVASVVLNAARSWHRSEVRRRVREDKVAVEKPVRGAALGEAAEAREARRALHVALAGLPSEVRAPILLHVVHDFSQREVAHALGLPVSTVSKRIQGGLGRVRAALRRAGFASLAGAGLASALQEACAVEAPATLAAAIPRLAAQAAAGKTGLTGAAASAAAKGGMGMKLVAGIVLAGAVAAGVAAVSGRGGGGTHASPAGGGGGNEVYSGEVVLGQFTQGGSYGPGRIAQGTISTDRIFSAQRKRLYWFLGENGRENANGLLSYDPETGLKEIVAGSGGIGDLDGPREAWRAATWHYQEAGIGLDDEKGTLYVLSSSKVKAISLEDGSMRTVAEPGRLKALCLGADGNIYCSSYKGVLRVDPATGKDTVLSTEPFPGKDGVPWGYMAADIKRGKLYGHRRGAVYQLDLKTGKFSMLCGGGGSFAAGPFKDAGWYCPSGATMTLDGRYLIVGGGDQQTYTRLDLEKRRRDLLVRRGKGAETRWTWGDPGNKKDPGVLPWPGSVAVDANTGDMYYGNGVWPFAMRLKRAK